jgi:ketosteroid isomerase-like protein
MTAKEPEDIARLFVARANARDLDRLVTLYEPDAVLGYPPGETTVGRDAIRAVLEQMLAQDLTFEVEEALPTLRLGDLALTAARPRDGAGARSQVARRQPDGIWLRILDRREAG